MPRQRITYGEHAWDIEYERRTINGLPAFEILKIEGSIATQDRLDQFYKALRPFWNSLDMPPHTALALHADLIPDVAPGSQSAQ
jgi:hypothetical protein